MQYRKPNRPLFSKKYVSLFKNQGNKKPLPG